MSVKKPRDEKKREKKMLESSMKDDEGKKKTEVKFVRNKMRERETRKNKGRERKEKNITKLSTNVYDILVVFIL